ncbi:MAG: hypothetical protein R3C11_11005 [Planctomycetaceae bacterium]
MICHSFIGTAHLWASFYQRGFLGKYVSDFIVKPAQESKQDLAQQEEPAQNSQEFAA